MKIRELFEADKPKPPKPPAPRPKKTLHFQSYELWVQDIKHVHPDAAAYKADDGQVLALDVDDNECYGKWNPETQKGVTFEKSRPIHTVISYRTNYTKIPDANDVVRMSAHQ